MTKKKSTAQLREEAEKAKRQKQFYEDEISIAKTQIKQILSYAFHKNDVQEVLRRIIEEVKNGKNGEIL